MSIKRLMVYCPYCKKSYMYKISEDIKEKFKFERGIEEIFIDKGEICNHELIITIDSHLDVRNSYGIEDLFKEIEFLHQKTNEKLILRDFILTKILFNSKNLMKKIFSEYFRNISDLSLKYLFFAGYLSIPILFLIKDKDKISQNDLGIICGLYYIFPELKETLNFANENEFEKYRNKFSVYKNLALNCYYDVQIDGMLYYPFSLADMDDFLFLMKSIGELNNKIDKLWNYRIGFKELNNLFVEFLNKDGKLQEFKTQIVNYSVKYSISFEKIVNLLNIKKDYLVKYLKKD